MNHPNAHENKNYMKVMGIMVMIVIGGDEGMMVVVAMMFLM